MSYNISQTILIGRLCDNPVLKTVRGKDLALFDICQTNRDKDGNESTLTHKIMSFGNQAQTVMQFLRKDDLCCIEGIIDKNKKIGATRITFVRHRSDN